MKEKSDSSTKVIDMLPYIKVYYDFQENDIRNSLKGMEIYFLSWIESSPDANQFYNYEQYLETEDLSKLVPEYNSLLVNMQKEVKVLDPKDPFEGKAMGITKSGELIVDTWESRKLVSSGEVSVRGIYGYV